VQDILRLLTLWFNHGASVDVQQALEKGFGSVPVETWLAVLPQIIARIHSNTPAVRTLIQRLLIDIGKGHPQALMYPLLVACKSISRERKAAAQQVVDKVRQHSQHSGILVDQVTTSLTLLVGWLLMSNLCSFGCEQKTGFRVCLICCERDECTNRRRKKLFAGRAALHLCADLELSCTKV
jgi:phosphatidylinositol kinase/protein kinase (PI-3  family)